MESSWYWQDQVFLLALITILTVLSRVLEDKKSQQSASYKSQELQ